MNEGKKEFRARAGAQMSPEQAQRYGERLWRMAQRDGSLTTDGVLREASKARSRLHDWFEWDDTRAGHLYRKGQAAQMLRAVEVVVVGGDGEREQVPAFHSIRVGGASRGKREKRQYVTVEVVAREEDVRVEVVGNLKSRVAGLIREMRALEGMDGAIRLLEKVEGILSDAA